MTRIVPMFLRYILIILITILIAPFVRANNLSLQNFSVESIDSNQNLITYSCDITWDNSWKNIDNHDAVWVFLKYSTDAGVLWHHASMSQSGKNPYGFSCPNGFEIIVPSDEKGFFLQRTDLQTGKADATKVIFAWDYAQDGLSDKVALASTTINKVYGIEMVYIPKGAFYVGDGSSSSQYVFKQGSNDSDPWYIQDENPITTTNGQSNGYYYQSTGMVGENNSGDVFLIPSSFPKGYKAFYQMKYELTEGQWVSFFNSLSTEAKIKRDITGSQEGGKNSDVSVNRNTISWDNSNPKMPATTLRPDRPVSYISWPDLLAYADWSGLRPMTELEFEKSCRGKDIASNANEFAWGKTNINSAEPSEITPNTIEDGDEQIFDGAANINANSSAWTSGDAGGQKGPLRVGIFAEASSSRATSGAGFYGTMELSGNLYEMVVSLGRKEGRKFLGSHGDGELTTLSGYEGNASNIDWPGISEDDAARGVISTIGSGYRGGDFQSPSNSHYAISNRTYAVKDPDTMGKLQRYDANLGIFQGGRLVRSSSDF